MQLAEYETLTPFQNKYDYCRILLLRYFELNRQSWRNPKAAYLYGFTDEQIEQFENVVPTVLQQLSRPFALVNCVGKTHREVYVEVVQAFGKDLSNNANTYAAVKAMEDALLNSASTLVLQRFSKSRTTDKPGHLRSVIKTLDDAHLRGFRAMSDVILIDYASFLERAWPEIGHNLRPIGPFDAWNPWTDESVNTGGGPTLLPL